ncbi:MAG: hypothetical protein EBY45_16510, partial [Gammaproteobacteria bacterium]|nr:hypothetical protein [Gammaproteobacteria bacterium]
MTIAGKWLTLCVDNETAIGDKGELVQAWVSRQRLEVGDRPGDEIISHQGHVGAGITIDQRNFISIPKEDKVAQVDSGDRPVKRDRDLAHRSQAWVWRNINDVSRQGWWRWRWVDGPGLTDV